MHFALTPDQQMIRDAADSFLADASGSAQVRAAMESAQGYDEALWQRIGAELGWCGIAIDEAQGGLGLGPVEMALVLEQMGRHLLCSPFFASIALGATLLSQAGTAAARERYLPTLAQGELRLGIPLPCSADGWADAATPLKAREVEGRWLLDGQATHVLDGATAQQLLLFGQTADGIGLFAIPSATPGLAISARRGWDTGRRFADIECRGVQAELRCDDATQGGDVLARATALARLYLAAENLGGAQQCLDMTAAYTATRKQFGRTIASFQAVKHRCAEMMVRVESLRSAVYGAAALAATPTGVEALAQECATVRALAADTFFGCAQEAIQLHGGVGFTWEYDPQLYFKRAQASSGWLGSAHELRERVAAHVIDAAGPHPRPSPASGRGEQGEEFRAEVAEWMRTHLCGRFESLKHRGGPGDEEADPALRKEWERELAAGGWTCVGWPKEVGGRGLTIEQQVIFHEEYARAGGPGRMGHIGEGLIGPALIRFGSEAQKRRFLPRIVDGTEFWCQGYSEPNAGSDLANVQTRCWQEADGRWRVQGQKIWTSLARESDWIFVLARGEPGSKGNKGLCFLLLPLDQPGIDIRPIRQMGGGAEFSEVFFDGAVAEADHMVGAPGEGWKVAMGLLEAERGVSTLGQQMHFAYELDLVIRTARANGRAHDPQIRSRIAQAWSGLRVMRYNALRMLSGSDATSLPREALIFKYYWSNWHRDLGKLAMDVLGEAGEALSDDPQIRPLQQLFFFSRADTIYAGTNEIQLNLIAERGLGMPREPRGQT